MSLPAYSQVALALRDEEIRANHPDPTISEPALIRKRMLLLRAIQALRAELHRVEEQLGCLPLTDGETLS